MHFAYLGVHELQELPIREIFILYRNQIVNQFYLNRFYSYVHGRNSREGLIDRQPHPLPRTGTNCLQQIICPPYKLKADG